MYLVDTSVWINLFSKKPRFVLKPEQLSTVVTCPPVIQEILQGIRDDLVYRKIRERLLAFPCLDAEIPLERYVMASELFRTARKKGIQVRSSVDCLIASIAIKYECTIIHLDRDFNRLSQISSLQQRSDF